MKVRFIGSMPSSGYSGGRLLALGMAESLALKGVNVEFLTNNHPIMMEEFKSFSRIDLKVVNFKNLDQYLNSRVDHLIIIPQQGEIKLHKRWALHGQKLDTKIHLLNFESANWFNEVSPDKKNPKLWDGWVEVSKTCNSIISISKEGNKYAKEFYNNVRSDCEFTAIYPGINSIKADSVTQMDKKKQILFVTRIDPHKGFNMLEPFLTDELNGYTLIIVVGSGGFPFLEKIRWKRKFKKYGLSLKIIHRIGSQEKFKLIKESAVLYFPTKFEGFGLPPLEAAYCKTACACSDLSVLQEFGQKAFNYGNTNVVLSMRNAIIQALKSQEKINLEWPRISKIAKMEEWGKRQDDFLQNI
ncbi:MAG: glycosyltransferase [Bacteroidota bacterium]